MTYCSFENLRHDSKNGHFCEKRKKNAKFTNVQVWITFYLFVVWKKRKYGSDAEFYEVFENHHHLSDLLN